MLTIILIIAAVALLTGIIYAVAQMVNGCPVGALVAYQMATAGVDCLVSIVGAIFTLNE